MKRSSSKKPVRAFGSVRQDLQSALDGSSSMRPLEDMICCAVSKWWLGRCAGFVTSCYLKTERRRDAKRLNLPGPVNNAPLFAGEHSNNLKSDLVQGVDYIFVPVVFWEVLVRQFGVHNGQQPIMIRVSKNSQNQYTALDIDRGVYMNVREWNSPNMSVDEEAEVLVPLDDLEDSLSLEADLTNFTHDSLFTPKPVVDLVPKPLYKPAKAIPLRNIIRGRGSLLRPPQNVSHLTMSRVGVRGLVNLNNSCYLNSVVQCLSNCPPVSKFFIDAKYANELNENVMGAKGEVAIAFGKLLRDIWSRDTEPVSPVSLKELIMAKSGFQRGHQEDAQELFSCLVNIIGEDINRVRDKCYKALGDAADRSDEDLANEAWLNLKSCSDSFIVDFFYGSLMSKVSCPVCCCASPSFEPFSCLSIPFPDRDLRIQIKFHAFNTKEPPQVIELFVPKKGQVRNLADNVGKICKLKAKEMLVTAVQDGHIHQIFTNEMLIDQIGDKTDINVYEIPKVAAHDRNGYKVIQIVLWEDVLFEIEKKPALFGHPFIIVLRQDNVTYQDVYNQIHKHLQCQMIRRDREDFYVDVTLPSVAEFRGFGGHGEPEEWSRAAHPFELFLVPDPNNFGSAIMLEDDGKILDFPGVIGSYVCAAKFPTLYKTRHFAEDPLLNHKSMNYASALDQPPFQLIECIEEYLKEERLGPTNAWLCPKCNKHQEAVKKIDFWSLPKIMVVHLKRFQSSKQGFSKIFATVSSPIDELDMAPFVRGPHSDCLTYRLVAVCCHAGDLGGGHYTANAENRNDHRWYKFDDTSVFPIPKTDLQLTKNGYMLFYVRKDV